MADWRVRTAFVLISVVSWSMLAIVVYLYAAMGWYLLGHNTQYAERFSEQAFGQVQPGLSLREVEGLLGPPLEIDIYAGNCFVGTERFHAGGRQPIRPSAHSCPGSESDRLVYHYSLPGRFSDNFYVRTVVVSEQRVTETYSYFWYD
jgi:hypothetical protein